MSVNFSPHRQGASHVIERHDVVLLRGTPVYDPQIGTFDIRICIRANGVSTRAMWLRSGQHGDDYGLTDEFHLWNYRLAPPDVGEVRELLANVHRQFVGVAQQVDGNVSTDSLTFWADEERFVVSLVRDADERRRYSAPQVAAFEAARRRIFELTAP